jgi:branched-chain amino acid transport system permease protein
MFWVVFALGFGLLAAQPIIRSAYAASQFTLYFALALLALSLALIWGYAGILSFGQTIFFGMAGYVYAIVSLNLEGAVGATIALPVALLSATASAFVLGYFMFYGDVRDVYVAIMTLVVTLVIGTFLSQTAGSGWEVGSVALGGFNGIPGISNFTLGVEGAAITLSGAAFYWTVLAVLLAVYVGLRLLVNSRYGYALIAVREDEDRTEMLGYNVRKTKLAVFTLSGAIAGLGGVFYVTWGNYINPGPFTLLWATLPVVWVTFGGRESLLGPIVGAITIEWIRNYLSINHPTFAIPFVGAILLVSILLLPSGLLPSIEQAVGWSKQHLPTVREPQEGAPE